MDSKKILLLIGEFLFVATFLAVMWHFVGAPFSLGRAVFGAIFGMLVYRGIKVGMKKIRSDKTPS